MTASTKSGTILLDYTALDGPFWQDEKPKIRNVSAGAAAGTTLWTVSDEGSSVEQLTVGTGTPVASFGSAKSRDLFKLFPDFAPFGDKKRPEVDLEAMCLDGQRLWMCGAHCWAKKESDAENDKKLLNDEKQQRRRRARTLLGYAAIDQAGNLGEGRCLPSGEQAGGLLAAIARTADDCLRASLMQFSKRGGLDIEGLAVRGDAMLIGLRGPVCGGLALVLRATVEIGEKALSIAAPPGIVGLDLGGRGIRDLLSDGDDILVLAGPMGEAKHAADPRFTVHRWHNAWAAPATAGGVTAGLAGLPQILDLTPTDLGQKPEGLVLLPDGRLLVVHDGGVGPKGRLSCDVYAVAP